MQKIQLIEVGPRDGFQNICEFIPTEVKQNVIDLIADSGVKDIMVTSFVNPGAVPQMSDAEQVAGYCMDRYRDLRLSALVPNLRGAKRALAAGIKNITAVISVSEAHNKANVNRTLDESFAELEQIMKLDHETEITLDLATVFGCPFQGRVPFEQVDSAVNRAQDMGVRSVNLCDTIGAANPRQVREYVAMLLSKYPDIHFSVHIHDTRNMGMVNTLAAIESGITIVQASVGGLGGCPFAPGASGNTSSEDLVYMLNQMGYETGIDFKKLLKAALYAKEHIQGNYSGHQIAISDKYRAWEESEI